MDIVTNYWIVWLCRLVALGLVTTVNSMFMEYANLDGNGGVVRLVSIMREMKVLEE